MSWSRKSSTVAARKKPRPSNGLNHNLGSWKVLYNLEGDPVGRGYAGKVYRIHPKSIDCNSNSSKSGGGQFNSNAAELQITATTYACKSIRRWRCGKDTINKIRREIQAMNALQRDGGSASPVCLSKETSDGNGLIPAINPGLQLYAPSSAAPKLIAVHEDSVEVAIVMEYASGGNLYDLCNKVYRRPTSHGRCQISSALPRSYQNFHAGYSLGENFSAVTTSKISNGLISAKSPFDFDPLPTCLPETYVIEVMRKVTEGLAYMHQNLQMVHLDIKAENILLREPFPSSDVFITDFGLATVLNDGKVHRELAGTPDYVAPEVINYDPISFATDMWSVGVLTYYLLTGVSPFLGEDKEETMQNVTHGPIEFPPRLFRTRSNESVAFLKKLLVRKPSDRLSAEECLRHPWMKISSRFCEEIEEEETANMDSMPDSLAKSSSMLDPEDRAVCVRPLLDRLAKVNAKAPLLSTPKFIRTLPKISLPLVGMRMTRVRERVAHSTIVGLISFVASSICQLRSRSPSGSASNHFDRQSVSRREVDDLMVNPPTINDLNTLVGFVSRLTRYFQHTVRHVLHNIRFFAFLIPLQRVHN
ncbi:unnamed protein product [Calicophoron daubneyi]|uniref:Protein kinase domain-containing protein n=1 Tax=Calicophoron daubneyi TaxID=300641 RepID=A0AAV2TUG3_CALDB